MKNILLTALMFVTLYSYEVEYKSNISFKTVDYNNYQNENYIFGDTKVDIATDNFDIKSDIEYLYSTNYKQKRYVDINELYMVKEYDDYRVQGGKMIKFWGELEGFNVTDIFNHQNHHFDPFDKEKKLGSYGVDLTYYKDESSLELGVKLYEDDKKYPEINNPYTISQLPYSKELQSQNSKDRPSVYLKYDFTLGDDIQSDNKFILYSGYDNKRYFIPVNNTLYQYAYRVNKALFLSNIVYGDTIFKLESSHTKIKNDKMMSDYTQIGLGVENGFYDIGGVDINLFSEYYRYIYSDDTKVKFVDNSETYDNDILLALKLNFNDTSSTELKSGIVYDMKNYEKIFKTQFQSRIMDNVVLKAEYLQIISKTNTLLTKYENHNRAALALNYSF